MRRGVMLLVTALAASAFAINGRKGPPPPLVKLTQNDAEFAPSGYVPSAIDGVKVPLPPKFGNASIDVADTEKRLAAAIASGAKATPLKALLKDRDFVTKAFALDAIRTAGVTNVQALAASDFRYAAFIKAFLRDAEFMRLYAGAGLVPQDTSVGLRVMADIWAHDGKSTDFDKRLCAGIGAAWGAGPQSAKLRANETLPRGDGNRCDPVWRYFFFRQSEKAGKLHPNYANLRPWEIRFLVGNSWDDESLWWLQQRVNLPWDQYGWACWAAKYTGASLFGATVQGPLFYAHAPRWMGAGQSTVLHGGVCGALSHTGAHAAAAHGIPAYTVGQPGHCAYGFRRKRGAWEGGFGGPDGTPHNWIFPGRAPTMTRLMESAFKDDRLVDRAVTLLAFYRAGVPESGDYLARAWPHNYYVQHEYLEKLKADGKPLAPHVRAIAPYYKDHGFALLETVGPYEQDIERELGPEGSRKWFLAVHRAIANTPPSWAANDLGKLLDAQVAQLEETDESAFVGQLFGIYTGAVNDQAFGNLLAWSIANYVAKGREQVFADAFAVLADGPSDPEANSRKKGAAPPDKKAQRKMFASAIVAAEQAKSALAVNALTDLAEKQGLTDGCDPDRKLTLPAGERLVSDKGLLMLSTTSGWDHPIDHRNVLRDAPGQFHTDKETANWALVDLGEAFPISTVLVVKNSGNEARTRHLRVSRSTDGATFFPIDETTEAPAEWRVGAGGQRARWIKVERFSDEADFFHLRNILIFTKEAK